MKLYEIYKQIQTNKALSEAEKKNDKFDVMDYVKEIDGRWALTSKKTGKALQYYKGKGKPSKDWAEKVLARVEAFKHGNY